MALRDDLTAEAKSIFANTWTEREGTVVPDASSVTFGNDAVNLDATVLYADLSDSTLLVDGHSHAFAAEVYKAFLRCSAKLVTYHGGVITAYDGDRIMAVFVGASKNSSAVKCALRINWVVKDVIMPAKNAIYKNPPNGTYILKHTVGIDTSPLLVAKAGIRGADDLVWIGRAANYAAKLCALSDNYSTSITSDVYNGLNDQCKFSDKKNMWVPERWAKQSSNIYRSTYQWSL